ncbi:response regulator transcription factor [Streptomyces phaeoluteigriseus]|uniref:DNA-binding response regulator n=1 Tax=Streptomyces phaeoluteigriseus TaxID=114686 RepID=A0A1V6MHE0_9ACTN|nr:response regulator transcription factor [Streptomyces phaeoluteigriseus]OQD51881.1 DNA-binding response regulator [Streptomyces phaeoluteigriseus]USQ84491.1 response regulator transcription factor [Streptomyces phaeoluteigriseus]
MAGEAWRVLVVESDVDAQRGITHSLKRQGCEVVGVDSGSKALEMYEHADLVLLDLELSDLHGLDVCAAIRAAGDTPIIAFTCRRSEWDQVLVLEAGADDCLLKPYDLRELTARIGAVMRRSLRPARAVDVMEWGPLRIDMKLREVTLRGARVDCTRKEFDLLCLLASQPGEVVSRRQLMSQVWGEHWSPPSRTIDTHVAGLRRKLGPDEWITTIRGVGFCFEPADFH